MKPIFGRCVAVMLLCGAVSTPSLHARDHDRHRRDKGDAAAAAIIAGVVGLGIGVAISKHGRNRDTDYQWDHDQYGQPFSPANGVFCYPRQRVCYRDNHLAPKWTRRVFGDY